MSAVPILFGSLEFWSLAIVSCFGFRASNLGPSHFARQSRRTLTPATRDRHGLEDQIFSCGNKTLFIFPSPDSRFCSGNQPTDIFPVADINEYGHDTGTGGKGSSVCYPPDRRDQSRYCGKRSH